MLVIPMDACRRFKLKYENLLLLEKYSLSNCTAPTANATALCYCFATGWCFSKVIKTHSVNSLLINCEHSGSEGSGLSLQAHRCLSLQTSLGNFHLNRHF